MEKDIETIENVGIIENVDTIEDVVKKKSTRVRNQSLNYLRLKIK